MPVLFINLIAAGITAVKVGATLVRWAANSLSPAPVGVGDTAVGVGAGVGDGDSVGVTVGTGTGDAVGDSAAAVGVGDEETAAGHRLWRDDRHGDGSPDRRLSNGLAADGSVSAREQSQ